MDDKRSNSRVVDDLMATKVMGWELWQDDWYTPLDSDKEQRGWRAVRLWSPTSCADANHLVWLMCLVRAKQLGYELSQSIDEEKRFHINGDHPTAKRLLVVDCDSKWAVCRFAALLYDVKLPSPYNHAHGPMDAPKLPTPSKYVITKGMTPPTQSRPIKRTSLDNLIELAKKMDVGDAVALSSSESQTFRTILATLGFLGVSDSYRWPDRSKTLIFKMNRP